jgi:F-type H+-transporting ATPase subunit gamma
MATLRDIKARITGVKNTQQITKAMKMVAAARLRRAQENIINALPYSRKVEEVLNNLLSIEKNFSNILFEKRTVERLAVVVLTSDRGLCGGFNMNVIRAAEDLMKNEYSEFNSSGNLDLYCVGKKGYDYFKKRDFNVVEKYLGIFAELKFEFASSLVSSLKTRFLAGEIDKVVFVHNEFKSVAQQNLIVKDLLPIVPDSTDVEVTAEYIYEPDKISIIESLLPKYLNAQVWTMLLNSYAAELGARMTAMDMATENAKEMIRTLQIKYNKERQASITGEILEIVSGANALKEA